jgi:outer membrane protein OmpA-like peptidoglycan-associated protein
MLRRECGSGRAGRYVGASLVALPWIAAILAVVASTMPATAAEDATSATRAVAQMPKGGRTPGNESFGPVNMAGEGYASEQKVVAPSSRQRIPTIAAGPVWDQELRRNSAIQSRLRKDAGDRVFFSAGSAELGGRARMALSAQAAWLNRWREFEAAIEGHADDPGSEAENVALAARRAQVVRRRLIDEGVAPARLAIVAQGRARRVATCTDRACAAQNRRALTMVFTPGTRERLERASGPIAEALDQSPAGSLQLPAAGRAGVAR